MTETGVRPFCNGEEYAAFLERSCWRCVRSSEWPAPSTCDIEAELNEGMAENGTIDAAIAARMGYPERAFAPDGIPFLGWQCKEWKMPAELQQFPE